MGAYPMEHNRHPICGERFTFQVPALTAVEGVRKAGGNVVAVAVIVDRDTGAKEKIEAETGVPYLFAFGKDELGLS